MELVEICGTRSGSVRDPRPVPPASPSAGDAPRFQGDGGRGSAGRDPLYEAQSRFLSAGCRRGGAINLT